MADKYYKNVNGEQIEIVGDELAELMARDKAAQKDYRGVLVRQMKLAAKDKIEAFAPLYKQVNLLRTDPDNEMFSKIDQIRSASDNIEAQINSLGYEDLVKFDYSKLWPNF